MYVEPSAEGCGACVLLENCSNEQSVFSLQLVLVLVLVWCMVCLKGQFGNM